MGDILITNGRNLMKIHHTVHLGLVSISPKSKIYTLEKEITNSRGHLCNFNQELSFACFLIILVANMVFPMLTAEWLHLVLYFSTEYQNSGQNIKIPFRKYVVYISCEEWLNNCWKYMKRKLFAVQIMYFTKYLILNMTISLCTYRFPPEEGFFGYTKTLHI